MEAKSTFTCARERLEMELREIKENPPTHISFGPRSDDDVFKCQGIIMGAIGTPFEGGIFRLSIQFPSDYPFSPPEVKFLTKIYHPNVNEDGKIDINIGEQWTPAFTTETLLLSISSMLTYPILEHTENAISDLYLNHYQRYNAIAREWTQKYAMSGFVSISPDDQSLHSLDAQLLHSEVARLSIE
ncbi:ubiquitin-conjugating enzyme E2 30-like [Rhododendron vialii]|uniref:ubiquitin-conjugating enzyme E2 30-like n=1 Tax=Rhododendron vialii TaxID=182163 RepID=UPI00265E870D|nr:ubiquitin-conjugating enzyme E2 30-like [Rhododendron vialii]